MAQIGADPVGVAAQRPGVAGVGDTVADILTQLTSALDVEGACWGDDEAGAAFAEHYLPAAAAVEHVLAGAASAIHDVAAKLVTVAVIFDAAEHGARASWEV
jgi:hypothetical protein